MRIAPFLVSIVVRIPVSLLVVFRPACLVMQLAAWLSVLLSMAAVAEAADPSSTSGKETIVIRADRAWEEPGTGQVLHFSGNFELISPEWELRGDEADLYGPLDDPERIVARGAPALLTILDGEEVIEGEGAVVEYQRDRDILILREDARLVGEDVSMTSSEIVFDVAAERLRSSGTDGVEMVLERAR